MALAFPILFYYCFNWITRERNSSPTRTQSLLSDGVHPWQAGLACTDLLSTPAWSLPFHVLTFTSCTLFSQHPTTCFLPLSLHHPAMRGTTRNHAR
ncbi:hypothetical protein PISMIDRAFT_215293 [Pisolithus microcarpus 441]|uniref:Uncharacterized protein n=1 Tax=Pisolithus microcarpus 441 TaxID=765257 RepID=A0A0C9XYQ8_9AGAM|nr:hypothetical protein PISMIDRAFT_215293 [Pisolithus microcarpus 441]